MTAASLLGAKKGNSKDILEYLCLRISWRCNDKLSNDSNCALLQRTVGPNGKEGAQKARKHSTCTSAIRRRSFTSCRKLFHRCTFVGCVSLSRSLSLALLEDPPSRTTGRGCCTSSSKDHLPSSARRQPICDIQKPKHHTRKGFSDGQGIVFYKIATQVKKGTITCGACQESCLPQGAKDKVSTALDN